MRFIDVHQDFVNIDPISMAHQQMPRFPGVAQPSRLSDPVLVPPKQDMVEPEIILMQEQDPAPDDVRHE